MRKVVLVQQSPWVSWLLGPLGEENQAALRPFEHFVPVRMDFSDLSQQMRWLEEHPRDAEKIADRAGRWAREFLSHWT